MIKSYLRIWVCLTPLFLLSTAIHAAPKVEVYKPVAALYETRTIQLAHRPQANNQRWHLWRTASKIETQSADGSSGEVWLRDSNDNISMRRLFHKEKRIIEFTSGDLRTLSRYPEWTDRAELIEFGLLSRLKLTGTVMVLGHKAQRYQGQINGVDLEILWLAEYRLPALVRRVFAGREVSMHLLELHPLESSPWKQKDVSDYQAMDYADMGDNESDPFISSLSHKDTRQHETHVH